MKRAAKESIGFARSDKLLWDVFLFWRRFSLELRDARALSMLRCGGRPGAALLVGVLLKDLNDEG